jgi:hypothetical protein
MQSKKAIEHRRKQVKTAALPGTWVKLQRYIDASAEGTGPARNARGPWRRRHTDQSFDGVARFGRIAEIVKPQHLAQRGGTFAASDHRQMTERQVRH